MKAQGESIPLAVKCANGMTVRRWYDRGARTSVICVYDQEECQVGDAEYSGTREGVALAMQWAVKANGGLAPKPGRASRARKPGRSGVAEAPSAETVGKPPAEAGTQPIDSTAERRER